MRINLDVVFFLSQCFVCELVARGRPGKIIHLASMLSNRYAESPASTDRNPTNL